MTTLATPRPTSATGRVYPYLKDAVPRSVIERETGLSGMRLTDAIRSNYRLGYLPTPPLHERRRRLRVNTSAGKGGVWLAIKAYAPLCLTARQTQVAVKQYQGRRLSLSQIASAYLRERHRNQLQRPVAELTIEAQRDKQRTRAALRTIVRLRLAVDARLAEQGLARPTTLHEWIGLSFAQKLTEFGLVGREYAAWCGILQLYARYGRPVGKSWFGAKKQAERVFSAQCQQQESALLERLFAGEPEKLPTDPAERQRVLNFYHALEAGRGARGMALPHDYAGIPTRVIDRLTKRVTEGHQLAPSTHC